MRQKVITFFSSLPKAPEDQFNEALLLYMKSPVPNPGLIRSYNQQGYSAQRLKELLYDLKKAYDVKDSELVIKKARPIQQPETPVMVGLPEFSKGAQGNKERKDYLDAHNLVAPSAKNADMDAVILEHVKSLEVIETIDELKEPDTEKK